jgi:hypothetical protein
MLYTHTNIHTYIHTYIHIQISGYAPAKGVDPGSFVRTIMQEPIGLDFTEAACPTHIQTYIHTYIHIQISGYAPAKGVDPGSVVRTIMQEPIGLDFTEATCSSLASQDMLFERTIPLRLVASTWDASEYMYVYF